MSNNKILPLLGLARRAGRVSLGHDAAVSSIVKNKAKLCVLSSDASERLKNEFLHATSYENKSIPLIVLYEDMLSLGNAVGSKCRVLTVDDEGFANKILSLYNETDGKE